MENENKVEMRKVIDFGAFKANRELRKAQRAERKAERQKAKADKPRFSVLKKIGIVGSYAGTALTAAAATVAVIKATTPAPVVDSSVETIEQPMVTEMNSVDQTA